MVPVGVQTGCANGWREREQKLNGKRLNAAWEPPFLALETPAPALAENASSDAHSEWVIYINASVSGGLICDEREVATKRDRVRRACPFLFARMSVCSSHK